MPSRITPDQKKKFYTAIREGWDIKAAAAQANIGYTRARQLADEYMPDRQASIANPLQSPLSSPDYLMRPLTQAELSPVALDCLNDFGRFRYRQFGRKSSPWQEDAAQLVKDKLATPEKEYGVVNCPPGSGKSTLFTHDIPAWVTCRSRTIRGFLGSNTQTTANWYTGRLRSTFVRKSPMEAKSEDLALGLAVDAQATLTQDYGNFNPNIPDPMGVPWTKSAFTVAQYGEVLTDEKEATWAAFGRDSGFLGYRVNLAIWDDLVRLERLKTLEMIEMDRLWYISEAITRLEPGGLFILQGQRLGSEDLYRYSLDMKTGFTELDEDELFELGVDLGDVEQKFFHIKYKAHYEEHCKAKTDPKAHSRLAKPYDPKNPTDSGCLLDPMRLGWRELKSVQALPLSNYRVVYQQEDTDPDDVLVPGHWIEGGVYEGEEYPGCWDDWRTTAQIPGNLAGRKFSVVTVDPSPTKFWSIQWWLYVEPPGVPRLMGNRYLLDMVREPMGANDILDFNTGLNKHTGLLVNWHERSVALGMPFTHLIVERNAAQRFLLQYEWFRQWCSQTSVIIRPHDTSANKADPEFGVKTIRNHYRFGRVRFPGTPEGRRMVAPLISEVTRYPDSSYDDCVMAQWFFEFNLPKLVKKAKRNRGVYDDIPSWAKESVA